MSTISVSTLVFYLKKKLETDTRLQRIEVSGELSNYRRHTSGHLYFTLKDDQAQISCVMFRSYTTSLTFEPKDGDRVILKGSVSLYEKSGQIQCYVTKIEKDGLGILYQRYEELRRRLASEGLFDESLKIEKPFRYPERVAVLVGEDSAAMSDIRTQFALRWPLCQVDYYPVLVQGEGAAEDIIRNLRRVDDQGYDAVILSRGGGSFEHLFCFNDESLVRTIVSMKTFLVTGIGHEQDFTLADFAADVRCPTPTAAAVYVTPRLDEVSEEILEMEETLEECVASLLEEHAVQLKRCLSSKAFRDPYSLIQHEELTLDYLQERMLRYTENFHRLSERIDLLSEKRNHAAKRIKENSLHMLEKSLESLHLHVAHRLEIESLRIKRAVTLIEAYSREKVLERGFSLVYKEGRLVASKTALEKDDDITVVLKDGSFTATVKEV